MAVRLVQSEHDSFDDFCVSLESRQSHATTPDEITELIAEAREYSKSHKISGDERQQLATLRNKLYGRRRALPACPVVTGKICSTPRLIDCDSLIKLVLPGGSVSGC